MNLKPFKTLLNEDNTPANEPITALIFCKPSANILIALAILTKPNTAPALIIATNTDPISIPLNISIIFPPIVITRLYTKPTKDLIPLNSPITMFWPKLKNSVDGEWIPKIFLKASNIHKPKFLIPFIAIWPYFLIPSHKPMAMFFAIEPVSNELK